MLYIGVVLFLYINCYTREVCMKSDVQLNLRAKESQRALIDAAAEILHKSRTDFILEMACKAAENVILDRRVFKIGRAHV